MKLKRHKFKYLAYVFDVEAGMTLVPIEYYLDYVLPIDVEHLELAFERTKEQLAEAEEENSELRARINAYLEAQEPKGCAAPVCGTLCKACEENI